MKSIKMRNWRLSDADPSHEYKPLEWEPVTATAKELLQRQIRQFVLDNEIFDEAPDGSFTTPCCVCGTPTEVELDWFATKQDAVMYQAYCGGSPRCCP